MINYFSLRHEIVARTIIEIGKGKRAVAIQYKFKLVYQLVKYKLQRQRYITLINKHYDVFHAKSVLVFDGIGRKADIIETWVSYAAPMCLSTVAQCSKTGRDDSHPYKTDLGILFVFQLFSYPTLPSSGQNIFMPVAVHLNNVILHIFALPITRKKKQVVHFFCKPFYIYNQFECIFVCLCIIFKNVKFNCVIPTAEGSLLMQIIFYY